jgi:peptide/nickel transport system permease protein
LTELLSPTTVPPTIGEPDAAEAAGLTTTSLSPGRLALRRFVRHRAAMIATIVLALITLACILAPVLAPYGRNERVEDPTALLHPPSTDYWFGTDDIARDLYSRILWGGRVSLFIGIAVALSAGIIGALLGAVAGFRGGKVDNGVMRVTDMALAFPILVTLLVVRQLPKIEDGEPNVAAQILGSPGSLRLVITLLVLVSWMGTARIVRGVVLSLKEKEFVEASKALGASDWRVITRHLLPNAIGPIIVSMTFTVAIAIAAEATLSYFGFGLNTATEVSWGSLLSNSKRFIVSEKWWMVVFPSMALLLTILAINFMGDGLRDALDPKQNRNRA